MEFVITRDGGILVPRRAELKDLIGDGREMLFPRDEDYADWRAFILRAVEEHDARGKNGQLLSADEIRTRLA